MNIVPGQTYRGVSLRRPKNETWSIRGGQLSGDLVAGLVLGLFTMLNQIENDTRGSTKDFLIWIEKRDGIDVVNSMYSLRDMLNPYYNTGRQFWGTEELKDLNVMGLLDKEFGWLIYNVDDHFYKLYRFQTPEFIQGFITICRAFQVDFRDYIAGPPFKYQLEAPTYYQIDGYDIPLPEQEDEYKED